MSPLLPNILDFTVIYLINLYLTRLTCFCPRIPVSSLVDSWPSLLALLKDSVQLGLPAPGQFLILGLVSPSSLLSVVVQESVEQLYLNLSICGCYGSFFFLFSSVLNEFILKNPNLESKKDQRELQVIEVDRSTLSHPKLGI